MDCCHFDDNREQFRYIHMQNFAYMTLRSHSHPHLYHRLYHAHAHAPCPPDDDDERAGQVLPGLVTSHPVYVHTDRARCTRVHKIAKYRTPLACKVMYPCPLVQCKVLALSMLHLRAHPGQYSLVWQSIASPSQVLCMLHLRKCKV